MSDFDQLKEKYKRIDVTCELCDHDQFLPFLEYARVGKAGEYGYCPLKICTKCGHKATNPRYEDGYFLEYYDRMYRAVAYADLQPDQEYIQNQQRRSVGVQKYVDELGMKPGRLLDHGCAQGYTMKPWIDAGWQCKGFDPHRPSVEQGKAAGFDIELCSGEDMPYEDAAFDFVLSLGSLEHVYDLHKTMMELRRVIAKGGVVGIRWRLDRIFGSTLEYYNHNHSRFFTPRTLTLLLRLYGFTTFNATDKQLEGWTSYGYDFARREDSMPDAAQREKLITEWRDDAAAEVEKIKALRQDYYDRCKVFLQIDRECNGNIDQISARIKETGMHWKFMAGVGDALARSKMEAERYITNFDQGKVK